MLREINQITRRLPGALKEDLVQCQCSDMKKIKMHFTCLHDVFIYTAAPPLYLTPWKMDKKYFLYLEGKELMLHIKSLRDIWIYLQFC